MRLAAGSSDRAEAGDAVAEALAGLRRELAGDEPQLVAVFTSGARYDAEEVFAALRAELPVPTKIWGANSDIAGVITSGGGSQGISLVAFAAPDLTVGVASAELDWQDLASYRDVGAELARRLLADAGKTPDEPPKCLFFAGLHLITDTEIFLGIQDVLGQVPICGGNTGRYGGEAWVPGEGYVYSSDGARAACVSVAGLWMESRVGVAFGYPYNPDPEHVGVVTKADVAKRIVYEIDGRPAAEVFNEWTGGAIAHLVGKDGLVPLSVIGTYQIKKPITEDADYIALSFIETYADKSMFASHEAVAEGTTITVLKIGSEQDVVNKTAVLATMARNRAGIGRDEVAGMLVVYCYALYYTALAAGYNIGAAFDTLEAILGEVPFGGFFAGGEIGFSPNFGDHCNRMMSVSNVVAVFGR